MTIELDWRRLPLTGRVLIEASAGTGKTYTIGLIVLRLLLETDDGIDRLLVCTFTDAAAQELRDRIRARLVEVEALLEHWPLPAAPAGEPVEPLHAYLREHCGDDPAPARQRLRLARLELDRAAIGTIHGFLARVLREHPFLCGGSLLAEQMTDDAELLAECFDDFRRRCLQAAPAQRPAYRHLLQSGADALLADLRALFNNPDARLLLPGAVDADTLFQRERRLHDPAVLTVLREVQAGRWGRLQWRVGAAFPKELEVAIDALACGASLLVLGKDTLKGLTSDALDRGLLKKNADAGRPAELVALIDACEQALSLRESLYAFALGDALAWCRDALRRRTEARGLSSFSQLVERVSDALSGPNAEALAGVLQAAWPHALIDEFQDTDQRQFSIFERIYRDAGSLHLIGDPKQAIYGFRGGDVEAYLRAARSASDASYTLPANYRSAASMVEAVNTLYEACTDPFDHPQIRFRPVAPGRRDGDAGYRSPSPARLHFHVDQRDAGKTGLRDAAFDACAVQIVELLDGTAGVHIDDRLPQPGDIAILLPNNQQIASMRAALERRGVPCVGAGRQSVLQAAVAEELELLLHAALHPGDGAAVRAALGTPLLDFDHDALLALEADPDAAERQAVRFERWGRHWRERGPLALCEAVQAERAADELRFGDGERRLTDLRHLGELLQDEAPRHAGPTALFEAFRRQRRLARDAGMLTEDRQLRLESDRARVRLMTLHGCKGLQFKLVFLPLGFDGRRSAPRLPRLHDDAGVLCFDAGSAGLARNIERAMAEDRQERLRLLYVALTRAVHACHVYWHPDDVDSALAVLIGRIGNADRAAALATLATRSTTIAVQAGWPDDHARRYRPPSDTSFKRQARTDWPAPRPPQWLYSFSALARQALDAERSRADDDRDQPPSDWAEPAAPDMRLQRLAALRGLTFGNAMHALFERSDPRQPLWPDQRGWVGSTLAAFGITAADRGDAVIEALARRIDDTRACDLGDGLRLAALAPGHAVAEFQFHFPLHGGTLARLREACAAHGDAGLIPAGLGSARLDGMMSGAIDLVLQHDGRFHLLDYKSNWLGAQLDDYRAQALDAAMDDAHYPLQALIYAVALHRYLQRRLPDYRPHEHLGDAIYLFVRAVGLGPGLGIWRRRFSPALLTDVDGVLDGAMVAA